MDFLSPPFWVAAFEIIVADLVMSVDNVIGVAGAAKGSLPLLIFGLVVSIPLVVVAAGVWLTRRSRGAAAH